MSSETLHQGSTATGGASPHTHLAEHLLIELPPRCLPILNDQQVTGGPRDGVLAVEVGSEAVPILKADLEDLLLLHVGHLDQVHQPLHEEGEGRERWGVLLGQAAWQYDTI